MGCSLQNSALSSYLIERTPLFYGGHQEDYLMRAERAIASSVSLISKEIGNKTDFSTIYEKVASSLQDMRHRIALDHQTKNAHLFGIRRDYPNHSTHPDRHPLIMPLTGLYSQYTEYNNKYIEKLTQTIAKIPENHEKFKQCFSVNEIVMGRKLSFQIEFFSEEKKNEYTKILTKKELGDALGIDDKDPDEILQDPILMNRFRLEHSDLYERINLRGPLQHIGDLLTLIGKYEEKNTYILGTLLLELEPNIMVTIAKHLTWIYRDWEQNAVEKMKREAINFVLHQDPFLIEKTQKACGKIFADILKWNNTKPLDSLKDHIALLRFIYGNSMPCRRGDGAIGDWLEIALYRHHGFKNAKHNSKRLPCFEILSTPSLSDYLKDYREVTKVA